MEAIITVLLKVDLVKMFNACSKIFCIINLSTIMFQQIAEMSPLKLEVKYRTKFNMDVLLGPS